MLFGLFFPFLRWVRAALPSPSGPADAERFPRGGDYPANPFFRGGISAGFVPKSQCWLLASGSLRGVQTLGCFPPLFLGRVDGVRGTGGISPGLEKWIQKSLGCYGKAPGSGNLIPKRLFPGCGENPLSVGPSSGSFGGDFTPIPVLVPAVGRCFALVLPRRGEKGVLGCPRSLTAKKLPKKPPENR